MGERRDSQRVASKMKCWGRGELFGDDDFPQSIDFFHPSRHRLELGVHAAAPQMDTLNHWDERDNWPERDKIFGAAHGYKR